MPRTLNSKKMGSFPGYLRSSKEALMRMIEELRAAGAEAILLGCTELGMLVTGQEVKIPVYDTTLLHAKQAVDLSLSLGSLP